MQQSNLNLIPSGDMPIIYASQYDNNRVIRFNLFDGEDEYTLSGTETVKCNIRKNDEHIVVIVPTIGANKYIDVYLTEQACACFGDNIGEITISGGEDNIIGTINFILKVERNPIQGGVTSASDIADLESQIEDIVHEVMTDDYYTRDEVDAKLDLKANASDVYTKSEVDTALASKADAADVYTKSQVDAALGLKADKSDTYTKSQVDTALASKADASSVYTKSEVDTALAAKANASDVYTKTEVDEMIDELYPVDTVTGSIANFTTSLELPLVACEAEIVAQQASGTPTPSSPLPISGFSSVKLGQTSDYASYFRDLLLGTYGFYTFTGLETWTQNSNQAGYICGAIMSTVKAPIISQVANITTNTWLVPCSQVDIVNQLVTSGIAITGGGNIFITNNDYENVSDLTGKVIIYELATPTAPTITPEQFATLCTAFGITGETKTIALGQTVYGGVLDVKNGRATITHQIVNLGAKTWTYNETQHYFTTVVSGIKRPASTIATTGGISSIFVPTSAYKVVSEVDDNEFAVSSSSDTLMIRCTTYTDKDTFKAAMETANAQLVYELATPIEIDITANNFTTIAGEQNIFSDCGEVTVGFKQGIQAYIDSKIGG